MKKLKNVLPIAFLFLSILFIGTSCDNDSTPTPNDNQCNYQGFTFVDPANNIYTAFQDSDLSTEFFPNNGGPGIPAIEIYETSNGGQNHFVTDVVTLNATGSGTVTINGIDYPVTVTCQRAGTAVGDEFRFDIVGTGGVEAEYCGVIDTVIP